MYYICWQNIILIKHKIKCKNWTDPQFTVYYYTLKQRISILENKVLTNLTSRINTNNTWTYFQLPIQFYTIKFST